MQPSANAFLSKALGYIKSQKPAGGEPSYWVSTYLITYVFQYDFLHEKWLPLIIG